MTLLTRGKPGEPRPSSNGEKEGGKMNEDLKESVLKYLGTVSQAKNKEVARAVGIEKALVDKAIAELAKEGKIEYRSFGGITYIALPGKHET
jgi:Mn-dependent DtxR family transcriptional regulator